MLSFLWNITIYIEKWTRKLNNTILLVVIDGCWKSKGFEFFSSMIFSIFKMSTMYIPFLVKQKHLQRLKMLWEKRTFFYPGKSLNIDNYENG